MKYHRDNYENHNEISQAITWKSQWNIPGNNMKNVMKYHRDNYEIISGIGMKIAMKYPEGNDLWKIQRKLWEGDISLNH